MESILLIVASKSLFLFFFFFCLRQYLLHIDPEDAILISRRCERHQIWQTCQTIHSCVSYALTIIIDTGLYTVSRVAAERCMSRRLPPFLLEYARVLLENCRQRRMQFLVASFTTVAQ